MKIAIASSKKDISGDIEVRAGRARYYLIIDDSGELLETIKNPFSVGGGGAGFGVAKMLADKGVKKIVANDFGPNMIQAMMDRGITHLSESGSIEGFIAVMKKNDL